MRVPDRPHDDQPLCSTLANVDNTCSQQKSIDFREFCLPFASELFEKREIQCADHTNFHWNNGLSMVELEVNRVTQFFP